MDLNTVYNFEPPSLPRGTSGAEQQLPTTSDHIQHALGGATQGAGSMCPYKAPSGAHPPMDVPGGTSPRMMSHSAHQYVTSSAPVTTRGMLQQALLAGPSGRGPPHHPDPPTQTRTQLSVNPPGVSGTEEGEEIFPALAAEGSSPQISDGRYSRRHSFDGIMSNIGSLASSPRASPGSYRGTHNLLFPQLHHRLSSSPSNLPFAMTPSEAQSASSLMLLVPGRRPSYTVQGSLGATSIGAMPGYGGSSAKGLMLQQLFYERSLSRSSLQVRQ